jgi:hypothetical protein
VPRVHLVCGEGEKELWVAAAHDERVSLGEWLRRAARARLAGEVQVGVVGGSPSPEFDPPSPAAVEPSSQPALVDRPATRQVTPVPKASSARRKSSR